MSSSPEPIQAQTRSSCSRTSTRSQIINQKQKNPITVIEISDSESEEGPLLADMKRRAAFHPIDGPSRTRVRSPSREIFFAKPLRQRTASNDNVTLPKFNKPIAHLFLPSDEENEPPRQSTDLPPADAEGQLPIRTVIHVDLENSRSATPRPPLTPPETSVLNAQPEDQQQDNSLSNYLAQVLEIIPNVLPDHAMALITEYLPAHQNNVVEVVLHNLFDNPGYPKLDKKGKRKATETFDADNNKKVRLELDYGSTDRDHKGGTHYTSLAIDQLVLDFPEIPKVHIRKTFGSSKSFYAPTYLFLRAEKKPGARLPYAPKKRYARRADVKGKKIALADPEFEAEREWLVRKLVEDEVGNDGVLAEKLNDQEYEENGDGVECGCCFSTYAFDKMVQCDDGHLFCMECVTSYAENLLGSHNVSIVCMDQSGCKMPFPVSELRRFLPDKLMDLYERVKQSKEIEMAGLEGLEECPYCEYKCVIENPDERLFRCSNLESCGAITCRQCKKPDHLPKSCKEMEEDRHLDGRHAIEEAMTRALMRSCPKCNKAFVKDDGCNKMTCPNCRSLSCYVCRKLIPEGYAHFNQAPPHAPATSKSSNKCPLWDGPVEARHAKEVQEAAEKAKEDYRLENPDVDDKDIDVDIPKAPPPVQRPPNALLGVMGRVDPQHHPLQQLQQHHLRRHRQLHIQQQQHFDMFNDIVGQMWVPPEMPVPLPQPVAPPKPRVTRASRKKRK